MNDKAEDFFDYYESLTACCTFPGCSWRERISWEDLATDAAKPTVNDRHRAHFEEAHRVEQGHPEGTPE